MTGSQNIHTKYTGSKSQRDTNLNVSAYGEASKPKCAISDAKIAKMSHLFTRRSNGLSLPQLRDRSI